MAIHLVVLYLLYFPIYTFLIRLEIAELAIAIAIASCSLW